MIAPDHNSLWRFWRDNKKALRSFPTRRSSDLVQAGLVGLVLQAVDGTKIQAAASCHKGWTKEQMQKLLAAVGAQLWEVEKQRALTLHPPRFGFLRVVMPSAILLQLLQAGLDGGCGSVE